MANRAWMNFGHFYANLTSPNLVSCNFIVDSTNGNGLGIRSLKSNGYVKNVFMHTSSTPAGGNPNPASGYILIQLADNYARSICGMDSIISPNSGSNLTATTAGLGYVITGLGTATAAQWLAAGLPAGLTPTVGQSFIAIATGTIGGSATVQVPASSSLGHFELVGDPNLSLGPQGVSNQGGYLLLQCLVSNTLTAPANGTVLSFAFLLDSSSVNVDGL